MSLTFDLKQVENYKDLWYESEAGEGMMLKHTTYQLIHYTMPVALRCISSHNLDEWYWRVAVMQCLGCASDLTAEKIKAHMGLKTNATQLSRKDWLKKLMKDLPVLVTPLKEKEEVKK